MNRKSTADKIFFISLPFARRDESQMLDSIDEVFKSALHMKG